MFGRKRVQAVCEKTGHKWVCYKLKFAFMLPILEWRLRCHVCGKKRKERICQSDQTVLEGMFKKHYGYGVEIGGLVGYDYKKVRGMRR